MAVPGEPTSKKTAADLSLWLKEEVGPFISISTNAIPHGGTALSLLGLKDSTKDVDFGFALKEDFERFRDVLTKLGFSVDFDFMPLPNERLTRMTNPRSVIDVVDLRFPTWNRWRMTNLVLRKSLVIPYGSLTITLLDKNATFLFKTFPLRDTDLYDLKTILSRSQIDESRVVALFKEQDLIHRKALYDPKVEYEPLINVLELRTRMAGSLLLLEPAYKNTVQSLSIFASARFSELELNEPLSDLVADIRNSVVPISWDKVVGEDWEVLRTKLRPEGAGSNNR